MRQNKLFSFLLACLLSVGAIAQSSTTLPYSTGFEDATDNALWQYANATTNQWCIGSAANNGGSNALYISNDGGTSNKYTSNNTVSFAYRAFHFEKGDYVISFDWLCLGESANYGAPYDCMQIILTPASITLQGANSSTGALGELTSFGRNTTTAQIKDKGYIQLNCSNPAKVNYPYCFVDRSTWQSGESCEISISTEGDYYLVLCWYNDSGAHNPAATVDNLFISKKACGNIQNVATSAISSNSVTLTWNKVEEAIGYDYVVLPASGSLDGSQAVRTTDTTAVVNGLSANTEHVAYIRAICTEGAGSWKKATFRTDCA
ncbi:MAG: fibronectin type III domain-containing protein, partial [Bacteroidales bacterium]|nr:fibronectin type III domain-containing protein [Bacteroidales bacterium]